MNAIDHETKARALGCTCEWWGGGAIVRFDHDCPIRGRHILTQDDCRCERYCENADRVCKMLPIPPQQA